MKGFFTENLGLKLFALLFALLLELYFYSPDNSVMASFNATIEVTNIPPAMTIVSPPVSSTNWFAIVTVRGPAPLVNQLQNGNQKVEVPVPLSATNKFRVEFTEKNFRLPPGVEVIDIKPSSVEFLMERVVRKQLKVKVATSGELLPELQIDEIQIFPETIEAEGPRSELENVSEIQTQSINLGDLRTTYQQDLALEQLGKLTKLNFDVVGVRIKIGPKKAEKKFAGVKLKVLFAEGFVVSDIVPKQVEVTVNGPEEKINGLKIEDIKLYVDTKKLEKGTHNLGIRAELPEGLKIMSTTPDTVVVKLLEAR